MAARRGRPPRIATRCAALVALLLLLADDASGARFVNRFGQWREATTPAPPAADAAQPPVFRNGGRRQCPPRAADPTANVGYERFDPNRCVEADVGVLAGWRPDLQGARRPGDDLVDPLVELHTRLGPLTGLRVSLYDRPGLLPEEWPAALRPALHRQRLNVTAFLGVPYAQPPLLEARFKPPRAHPGWQRWLALDYGPACPQPAKYVGHGRGVREVDEDCLYLNVFTPQVSSNVKELYAVMVHIHGGEFGHGASNLFPGHMLAAWGNVVVVTLNYRLGALGFLSTGDHHSPGNYGLLDQAMALRWVRDNIHYFNGDRRRITVFGDGAGAASAALLAVSPSTASIVHQVIAQSGSPLADWGAVSDLELVRNTSRVFGERIGCLTDTSERLVSCLSHGRSAIEIGDVDFTPDVGVFPWAPVVQANISLPADDWYDGWRRRDWLAVPDRPERLYRARRFSSELRLLTGVNRDEAAPFVYRNLSLAPDYEITRRWFNTKVREWAEQHNYTLNLNGVVDAVSHLYTYWPDPASHDWIRLKYIQARDGTSTVAVCVTDVACAPQLVSDALYTSPVDALVKLALQLGVPTYQYVLNTTVEALAAPLWRQVPHGLQYYLLTGAPFMDPEFFPGDVRIERAAWTELDRNMSQLFIEAFANFAKYGRPTPRKVLDTVSWLRALPGDQRYLSINNTFNSTMFSNYRQTESAFWSQYLPTLVGHELPTFPPSTEFWWGPDEPLQIAFWCVTALAFFLLLAVAGFCCLLQNAKRKSDRLYEESFMDGNMGVQENAHFVSNVSKPPSVDGVNDISVATNQTSL